jgi:hypothetical protein
LPEVSTIELACRARRQQSCRGPRMARTKLVEHRIRDVAPLRLRRCSGARGAHSSGCWSRRFRLGRRRRPEPKTRRVPCATAPGPSGIRLGARKVAEGCARRLPLPQRPCGVRSVRQFGDAVEARGTRATPVRSHWQASEGQALVPATLRAVSTEFEEQRAASPCAHAPSPNTRAWSEVAYVVDAAIDGDLGKLGHAIARELGLENIW